MRYLVTAEEMRRLDDFTISEIGIPAAVLMERAALAAFGVVQRHCAARSGERGAASAAVSGRETAPAVTGERGAVSAAVSGRETAPAVTGERGTASAAVSGRVVMGGRETATAMAGGRRTALIMAGVGNNGGDGLALARLLAEAGFVTAVWIVGAEEKASSLWLQQRKVLEYYPVEFCSKPGRDEYTILVDALFGVGLSRELSGPFLDAVEDFNALSGWKLALDMPSGVDSDSGRILSGSVRADETVTFGRCKRGLVLYPGCLAAGEITVADIGIPGSADEVVKPGMFALDESPAELLPERCPWGNKGTFGKVLLAAGGLNMAGAAVLAAKAAYRAGAGMVKVITSAQNRQIIQAAVPEALVGTEEEFASCFDWADVIAIGPGLGREASAVRLLEEAAEGSRLPLLMDADALNLLAQRQDLRHALAGQGAEGRSIVLTPHVGELARLCGESIAEIKEDPARHGSALAARLRAVVAAKDARSFICAAGEPVCVNIRGGSGLATAGSGDVLAGLIAGLMAQGMGAYRAACAGAYLHGCAGEAAARRLGEHACMAGDLV